MNNSKVAIRTNKIVSLLQMFAGCFFVFIFGICTLSSIFDKSNNGDDMAFLIFCLVMDALGIWLIVLSRKNKNLRNEFSQYEAAISNGGSAYIPDIAVSVGASEDVVRKNLELMIKKKFFSNSYIDRKANSVVIENKQPAKTNNAKPYAATNAKAPMQDEIVTVKCKGCGAMNAVKKGSICECEFCGSATKGE